MFQLENKCRLHKTLHVIELPEIPKLSLTDLEVGVVTRVGVSTHISHPHIIAVVSQYIGQTLVGKVN